MSNNSQNIQVTKKETHPGSGYTPQTGSNNMGLAAQALPALLKAMESKISASVNMDRVAMEMAPATLRAAKTIKQDMIDGTLYSAVGKLVEGIGSILMGSINIAGTAVSRAMESSAQEAIEGDQAELNNMRELRTAAEERIAAESGTEIGSGDTRTPTPAGTPEAFAQEQRMRHLATTNDFSDIDATRLESDKSIIEISKSAEAEKVRDNLTEQIDAKEKDISNKQTALQRRSDQIYQGFTGASYIVTGLAQGISAWYTNSGGVWNARAELGRPGLQMAQSVLSSSEQSAGQLAASAMQDPDNLGSLAQADVIQG